MNWLSKGLISITVALMCGMSCYAEADTIPESGFKMRPTWRIGAELRPGYVPGTNDFLRGDNPSSSYVKSDLAADVRAEFGFNPDSRQGILYKGLYQGVGIGVNSFFAGSLLGTPVSAYVYQGAPFVWLSDKISVGYEWRFGAAFGWKYYTEPSIDNYSVVSTSVTAHMGIGIKFYYELSKSVRLSLGVDASHYSNGNTSWPNAGVNSIGASIGMAYTLKSGSDMNHAVSSSIRSELERDADRGAWMYDIVAFGAWRKRVVFVGPNSEPELCPGRFGVLGVQVSPMRKLNRWVAVGAALDMQWDEGAALSRYWVDGTYGDDIKFTRPPFLKQTSIGLSAHAELTMPIFSVNVGLGYDLLRPSGNRRPFYQSLTLKTFLTDKIFINTGYRLGRFKEPQNLMLGLGIRL